MCWTAPTDLGKIKRGQKLCPNKDQLAQLKSLVAAARKRKKREAKAKREKKADQQLRAILNDPKAPPAARKLAAAVLGVNSNKANSGAASASTVAKTQAPTRKHVPYLRAGNQAIISAFTPGSARSPVQTLRQPVGPTQTRTACLALAANSTSKFATPSMRSAMCNSSSYLTERRIAAVALQINPDRVLPISGARSKSGHSHLAQSNNVWRNAAERFKIAVVRPPPKSTANAKSGVSAQTVKPLAAMGSLSTFSASANPAYSVVQDTKAGGNPLERLNQFYQSPLGSSALDVAAEVGKVAAPEPVKALSDVKTGAELGVLYQKGDYLGIGQIAASEVSTSAAEAAGGMIGGPQGAAVAGGITQGALDVGTKVVAPWLGNVLYNSFPSAFTPSTNH